MSGGEPNRDVVAGAARLYANQYGHVPDGIWRAPGRVNLIGEHTDYNDGFALPFALPAGVIVAAGRRADDRIVVVSRQLGVTASSLPLAGLGPGAVRGWAADVAQAPGRVAFAPRWPDWPSAPSLIRPLAFFRQN